jgi:hypothetical protein
MPGAALTLAWHGFFQSIGFASVIVSGLFIIDAALHGSAKKRKQITTRVRE